MTKNLNEKYLLNYIGNNSQLLNKQDDLISLIYKYGTKINFYNVNPVNQILDELNFEIAYGNLTGK